MRKYLASIVFTVEVELDETKFDEAFMQEFRESFYNFDTIEEHAGHIAQLEARGLLQDFTEGYGPIKEMGIGARTVTFGIEEVGRLYDAALPTEEEAG